MVECGGMTNGETMTAQLDTTNAKPGAALGTNPGAALGAILGDLSAVIAARHNADGANSYTAQLLAGDGERLLKKVVEEAGEVAVAAALGKRGRVLEEVADLWFHTLVLMQKHAITLDDLARILADRRGISGIDEKAARAANPSREE